MSLDRDNDSNPRHAHVYLWPSLRTFIAQREWPERRVDLGCGKGATASMLSTLGFDVTGVDISPSVIAHARTAFPGIRVHVGSAYDDLAATYGTFPLVVSVEVIEHCMDPRSFVKAFLGLIAPGGYGFLSTPYHSYLKNLALAVSGRMDSHFTALCDGGHVKFFSMNTLGQLLKEGGVSEVRFLRVGRIPILAKSMIAVVRRNT